MALTIPDYTYIAHKLINRPWGSEVRFTVARSDGSHINEVIPIKSMKIEEKELVEHITARLKQIEASIVAMAAEEQRMIAEQQKEEERKTFSDYMLAKIETNPKATLETVAAEYKAATSDSKLDIKTAETAGLVIKFKTNEEKP